MPEERIYTIPLIRAKSTPRTKRAKRAVKEVRDFLAKHMKSEEVMIDSSLNEKLWSRGRAHIPSRVRVKAVKGDDGVVWAYTPEAEIIERKKEEEAEEKVEEQPAEEAVEEEKAEEQETGTEEAPEEQQEEVEEVVEEQPEEQVEEAPEQPEAEEEQVAREVTKGS